MAITNISEPKPKSAILLDAETPKAIAMSVFLGEHAHATCESTAKFIFHHWLLPKLQTRETQDLMVMPAFNGEIIAPQALEGSEIEAQLIWAQSLNVFLMREWEFAYGRGKLNIPSPKADYRPDYDRVSLELAVRFNQNVLLVSLDDMTKSPWAGKLKAVRRDAAALDKNSLTTLFGGVSLLGSSEISAVLPSENVMGNRGPATLSQLNVISAGRCLELSTAGQAGREAKKFDDRAFGRMLAARDALIRLNDEAVNF